MVLSTVDDRVGAHAEMYMYMYLVLLSNQVFLAEASLSRNLQVVCD